MFKKTYFEELLWKAAFGITMALFRSNSFKEVINNVDAVAFLLFYTGKHLL